MRVKDDWCSDWVELSLPGLSNSTIFSFLVYNVFLASSFAFYPIRPAGSGIEGGCSDRSYLFSGNIGL